MRILGVNCVIYHEENTIKKISSEKGEEAL